MLTKVRSAKLTAVATAAVMLGATAAAAATGSLPSPMHHAVAPSRTGIEVSVPDHATTEVAPNLRSRLAKKKAVAKQHASMKKHASLIAATKVAHERHHAVGGIVVSVNGVTDPGTCGTAGAAGSFTLTDRTGTTVTVNVDSATEFDTRGKSDSSFAKVCVAAKVAVFGELTDTTIAATKAFVLGDHDSHDGHDAHDRNDCDHSKQDRGHDSNQGPDHGDHDFGHRSRHGSGHGR